MTWTIIVLVKEERPMQFFTLLALFLAIVSAVLTVPILEEMGYDVSTVRVQWALPPRAKLRLRSKGVPDLKKIAAIESKATGMLTKMLVSSAAQAKRIQSGIKFGTAIIDVDVALPPRVKMSFVGGKGDKKEPAERDVEDLIPLDELQLYR